jgi:hypothetical protein
MSERTKPHNGRDQDGHFRVREVDLDDLVTDPDGMDYIEDDIRLGGAVADTGPEAVRIAARLQNLIDNNRMDVDHLVGRNGRTSEASSASRSSQRAREHSPGRNAGRKDNRVQQGHRGR